MSGNLAHSLDTQSRLGSARSAQRPYVLLVEGWLGHVFVLGVLVLWTAVAVQLVRWLTPADGSASIPIGLLAVLACLLILAALRVRVEPCDGIRIDRSVAPGVHAMVDRLRGKLRAGPFAGILLGTGLDVRTIRVPRLAGFFGFDRYLLIGLPAMLALPPEHLEALIAHELAHECRGGMVPGARIYRQREGWLQLLQWLPDGGGRLAGLFLPFYRWYVPRFAASSFGAARDHELAADRRAALLTTRNHLAGALLRLRVVERFLVERFQPRLLADLRRCGVPPTGLHTRLEKALDGVREDERFRAWVDAAIHRDPSAGDTHPVLRARLAALALTDFRSVSGRAFIDSVFSDEFAGASSASQCLAALPTEVVYSIEKAWIDEVQSDLTDRHEELLRLDERRQELENRSELTAVEMLQHAIATAETDGIDAALPELRQLARQRPRMAPARFVLGTLLLQKNDADGLAHIDAAIGIDPDLEEHGRDLGGAFLRANGRYSEAEAWLSGPRIEPGT